MCLFVFFFKQKTAYEMRISDWSSDVCSSDLAGTLPATHARARASGNRPHTSNPRAHGAYPQADRWRLRLRRADARLRLARRAARGAEGVSAAGRSEERSVGKGGVRTCRSRWVPYH